VFVARPAAIREIPVHSGCAFFTIWIQTGKNGLFKKDQPQGKPCQAQAPSTGFGRIGNPDLGTSACN
jgi:hypothetical protein